MRGNLFLIVFLLSLQLIWGQDTFSIVAVDSQTGEVGSAGATCLDTNIEGVSAKIISDILPGKGAIHTQSFWTPTNQQNARLRMLAGDSPQQIMDWLEANDVEGNAPVRQYGAVDFDENGQPRAAAFTGDQCFDVKGQRVGLNYAIQGNILIGQRILDSMEARFLATSGSLAEKLMAAMQGARFPGADSRCLAEGVSSRSAFLRVARPGDAADAPYLDLHVPVTGFRVEPIDVLQNLFDDWLVTHTNEQNLLKGQVILFPNPTTGKVNLKIEQEVDLLGLQIQVINLQGKLMLNAPVESHQFNLDIGSLVPEGLYYGQIFSPEGKILWSEPLIFQGND